ncbi:uncharacterized protein LOC143898353 [Temnothorax americanus]|uniref:uncharacterized protein LOC143898353 n=1 Tax=Temnothorax americanus TaxID=1964332 RepID=UPI004069703B
MRPIHNAQSSQETLHEVRRKLQSLHNVLQTYQDTSRSPERQESAHRVDETNSLITYPVVDISSEYFELNRSEDSLSSLTEYSSRTSKTYQRSGEDVTLQNTFSKGFSRHNVQRSDRSNLPSAFVTTEPHLRSCNAILQTPEDEYNKMNINEYKRSECEQNTLDHGNELESQIAVHELESNPEANKDAIITDTLFNTRDSISEAISERISYILSPENKNIQTQNEASLKKRFPTEKFSDAIDKEQYQDNVIISQKSSQNKISNNSGEDKSTELLLQEALHFKNALLTQSRKTYPMSDVKQDDIADEFPPMSNNNFPSMIIDIKEKAPVISDSHDKLNQHYICLEMKQRRDVLPQSLKKVNTFAHREDERDTKSEDYIPETSSEYFSITDLAVHNNAETENNVALTLPVYEKVISIAIPVNMKNQDEIDMNERPMQTKAVLRNIQTRVNLRENLRENAASNIDNVIDKRSPTMSKLEDLILERVKNIRDYMDTFLQSQNTAIFKARRALHCQGKSDIFQFSDEASHVVIHNRSTAPSSCSSTDQFNNSSKKSSDFLTHVWPNYIQEHKQETDDVLRCSSDVYLKRNPGMFTLINPIKNKFSNKNSRQSEVPAVLEREENDLSLPTFLTYSCRNDSKYTHRIIDSITPRSEEHIVPNTENDKIDKGTVDVNADFHKRRKQTQIAESKPSTIFFPLDVANADAKVIHVTREEYLTKSNCNSISHSNSYFTDEEMISDMKMDNVSSKSTSNMKHLHVKSDIQKEKKHNVIERQISVDECPDANITMPSQLPSDNEYSNLTILVDSNLILDKSRRDNSIIASPLKEDDFIFDPETSFLPFSLDKENKTLNADNTSLNNLKHNETKNDEISVDIAHLSPRIDHFLTKPFQQIKAKSDISLITSENKDLKVTLYPEKSHPFLMRHNAVEYIGSTSHQPYTKLHNDKNKCVKNKLRLATQSKSIISPRRVSTKSCIPILKNRLESSHRMKRQAQARSPVRGPLTMLWGEKTCTRDHTTDKEIARSDNVSMNKHLHVETVPNFTKLNTERDIFNKKLEKPENVTYRNISKKSSAILSTDQNVESLTIDKDHSDKKDTYGSKSDTSIIQRIEKIASKEVVVISIMANDSLRKKYPADLFILTKNISPTTDLLIHKNKLWTITVEKTEKEVTAKPSITDTCTSMSALQ